MEREIGVGMDETEKGHAVGAAADGDGPAAWGDFLGNRDHRGILHKKPTAMPWALESCRKVKENTPYLAVRRRRRSPRPAKPSSDALVGSGTAVPEIVILLKLQLPEELL